jgi:hypothetical protein
VAVDFDFEFTVSPADHLDVDVEFAANTRRHTGGVQS